MDSVIPVICLDGPSGTGKGTIANLLAEHLGWHILDSGALYRIVAVCTEEIGIKNSNIKSLCDYSLSMEVEFSTQFKGSIVVNNKEISSLVRLEESGEKASLIAALPELRAALLERQKAFQQAPGLVADGRDMGTVVFPNSEVKIFLTASAEERARRRYKQLINKGVNVNLRALLGDIEARDERDSNRSASPLVPAKDAIVIDTTTLSIEQVLETVLKEVNKTNISSSS
jgi:CMP/dCMP kinase